MKVPAFDTQIVKLGVKLFQKLNTIVVIPLSFETALSDAWSSCRTPPSRFALDEKQWGTRCDENPAVSMVASKPEAVGLWFFQVLILSSSLFFLSYHCDHFLFDFFPISFSP